MDPRFHAAQAALADGDVERLKTLLAADPELATARSECSHPTLLQCLVLTMPPVDALEDLIDLLANHGAELTDPLIAAASGRQRAGGHRNCWTLEPMSTATAAGRHWRRHCTGITRPAYRCCWSEEPPSPTSAPPQAWDSCRTSLAASTTRVA